MPPLVQETAIAQLEILRAAIFALERMFTLDSQQPHPLALALLSPASSTSSSAASIVPRPLFFLLGHTASALFLLEHAIWSLSPSQESTEEREMHIEAFIRWVDEGPTGSSLQQAINHVERVWETKETLVQTDKAMLYGTGSRRVAKL